MDFKMENGSVSAPGGKRLPPQDQHKKNISLGYNALLEAVASWVTYDNFLAMKKLLAKCRRSLRNADGTIQDPLKELHPLLTLVSYDNENVILDENVRKILHVFLRFYMPKANLYSPRKMKNDARLIKTLCEMRASVMAEDEEGYVPLKIALAEERLDLVEAMVEFSSAKATECNTQGDTILHILLKNYKPNMGEDYSKKFLNIIDKSISKGANLNQRDKHGKAPIHLTAKPSYAEVLKKLVNRGANLNLRTSGGDSVLMLACKSLNHESNEYKTNLKWIEWLAKHRGVDMNAKDNEGISPLHYAAQNENLSALMKILIKAGADIHAVTHKGTNPLHLVTETYNFEAMRYFIERGVEFNRRNIVHGLTLMFMIYTDPNDEEPAEFLFRNGLDRSEEGDLTLLHLAAALGYVEIVEKLIEHGANVNCKDDVYQYTPLHLASMRLEFATVPELRKAGLIGEFNDYRASVKILDVSMEVYYGYYHGICNYESTVLALLKAGADVHALDNRHCTPLHYAARHREENDLIEILLCDGARVDDVDSEGLLPLHYSMLSENDKAMKHLLAFGADFNDVEHPRRNICDEVREFSSTGLRSHLIKLIFANLPINHLYKLSYYRGIITHKNAKDSIEYLTEYDELRNHMLTSQVSLYDWLRMNWKRRLTHIDSLPRNVEDKYRHYGIVIQSLREQTRNRKSLIEPAKRAFELLTDWQWPDLCVEHVLSFLKNRTLRLLTDAAVGLC